MNIREINVPYYNYFNCSNIYTWTSTHKCNILQKLYEDVLNKYYSLYHNYLHTIYV